MVVRVTLSMSCATVITHHEFGNLRIKEMYSLTVPEESKIKEPTDPHFLLLEKVLGKNPFLAFTLFW